MATICTRSEAILVSPGHHFAVRYRLRGNFSMSGWDIRIDSSTLAAVTGVCALGVVNLLRSVSGGERARNSRPLGGDLGSRSIKILGSA